MDNWNLFLSLRVINGKIRLPSDDMLCGNRYLWELRGYPIEKAMYIRCQRVQNSEMAGESVETSAVGMDDEPLIDSGELFVSKEGICTLPQSFLTLVPEDAVLYLINLPSDRFEIWESSIFDRVTEILGPFDMENSLRSIGL